MYDLSSVIEKRLQSLVYCCSISGVKHFGTCCYRNIIKFRMVTVTPIHHHTLSLIIFLQRHYFTFSKESIVQQKRPIGKHGKWKRRIPHPLTNLYISFTWQLDAGRENLIVLDLHSWCRCQWHFISTAHFIPRWQTSCITKARPLRGQQGQSFHAALSQCFSEVSTFEKRLCILRRWFCRPSEWELRVPHG